MLLPADQPLRRLQSGNMPVLGHVATVEDVENGTQTFAEVLTIQMI